MYYARLENVTLSACLFACLAAVAAATAIVCLCACVYFVSSMFIHYTLVYLLSSL